MNNLHSRNPAKISLWFFQMISFEELQYMFITRNAMGLLCRIVNVTDYWSSIFQERFYNVTQLVLYGPGA